MVYHYDWSRTLFPGALFRLGYEAVSFFFILSGFVLAYSHMQEVDNRSFRSGSFYKARLARIAPTYYCALVFALPLLMSERHTELLAELFTVPLFIQSWFPPVASASWNGPAWSLSVEMFFYAVFPVVCRLTAHKSSLAIAFVLVAATSIFRVALLPLDIEYHLKTWDNFCFFFPLLHLPKFILGVALGRAYLRTSLRDRTHEGIRMAGYVVLLGILVLKSLLPLWRPDDATTTIVFAMIIFGCAGQSGVGIRVLSWRPLVFLGEVSYALYITHWPLIWYWRIPGSPGVAVGPMVNFLAYFFCALILSILFYMGVEIPARSWLKRRQFSLPRVSIQP